MAGSRRLTFVDGETIKKGQKLTYSAGQNEYLREAYVTVTEVGMAGCQVRIDQVVSEATEGSIKVGQIIGAGWSELEMDTP